MLWWPSRNLWGDRWHSFNKTSSNNYIFYSSGYFETTRSPSRHVAEALRDRPPSTILNRPPHTAPSNFCPGCTHTCLIQFSSHSSLTLFNGCFLSRIRIRVCLPRLMSCRSYVSSVRSTTRLLSFMDSHVIDAWVHMSPERLWPYSLLPGTSTGITNRTSFLVFLWYSTKSYAPTASSRTLRCLPRRNRVSTVHACASFVVSTVMR